MTDSLIGRCCFPSASRYVGARRRSAVVGLALLASACGAGRSGESPPAAPSTEASPAGKAPPHDGFAGPPPSAADESAPRSTAPPAPGPGLPLGSSMTKPEAEGARAKSDELDSLSAEFDHALSLSTGDCTTPWALRDRICDLAQRLCDIAERSAELDVQERCRDGRQRCERATAKVRAACAE
jgi:hypothetical protein